MGFGDRFAEARGAYTLPAHYGSRDCNGSHAATANADRNAAIELICSVDCRNK